MSQENKTKSKSYLMHRKNNRQQTGHQINNELTENSKSSICGSDLDVDKSPIHIACTQEGYENVDVVWDWNSPQAKKGRKYIKKKKLVKQSPKRTIKRHPSNNGIQNFEKLREELQSLRNEIAVPDNEESLILSPMEEAEFKNIDDINETALTQKNLPEDNFEDFFNDSADEQLLIFSQRIETELKTAQAQNQSIIVDSKNDINLPFEEINKTLKKSEINVFSNLENKFVNKIDLCISTINGTEKSLDGPSNVFLQVHKTDSIDEVKDISTRQPRCDEQNDVTPYLNKIKPCGQHNTFPANTEKVGFHQSKHFPLSSVQQTKFPFVKNELDEIERKRREALAKLAAKNKCEHSEPPIKCSPEGIELKRLQALAKREAKKQQEIIEYKRKEALKRLKLSRTKCGN